MPRFAGVAPAVWAAAPGVTGAAAVGVWACAERIAIEEAASEATPPRNVRLVWVTTRDRRRRGPRKSSLSRGGPAPGIDSARHGVPRLARRAGLLRPAVRSGVVGHSQRKGHCR